MRLQKFSLRALFLCLTVFTIAIAYNFDHASRQREFVTCVHGKLGEVRYSWQFDANGLFDPNARPPLPDWLLARLGQDHLFSVTDVSLYSPLPERSMAWLHGNSNLRSLLLGAPNNTACLNSIKNNQNLRDLHIVLDGVIDFSFVPETPNVEMLWIEGATVKNLARLSGLKKLRYLRLEECDLSNATTSDYARLEGLKKLEFFSGGRREPLSSDEINRIRAALPNCIVK